MRRGLALVSLLLACSVTSTARATVIERVVAVVGERAVLLSDVQERAQPMLVKIYAEIPNAARRAAAISQVYKQMLQRMVDEELEQRAANQARIVVTAQEVDKAIGRVAAQNGITVDQLVAEATAAGLTENQYRSEIRRQVLEAKLVNLRLEGRIRVTEDDLRSHYRQLVSRERRKLTFRPAWIRIDAGSGKEALAAARERAERIAIQARQGEPFAELARAHSDDERTRGTGGLVGRVRPGRLAPALDRAARRLAVGEFSSPVRVVRSFFVMTVIEREESELPSFNEARAELSQRVYLEKMNKARRHWLDGLRRRTHVDIRL